jgi:hypothetical protein
VQSRREKRWLILGLLLIGGATGLLCERLSEPASNTGAVASTPPIVAASSDESASTALDESRAELQASLQESPRASAETIPVRSSSANPAGAIAPGTLIVEAIDPSRLGLLRWFDVRVANSARFAERRSSPSAHEVELPLTPGIYSAAILSPGYEPVEIPTVEVRSGETVRPAPIMLMPGSGEIFVEVNGTPDLERKLVVELLGEGRHPCSRCASNDDRADFAPHTDAFKRGDSDVANVPASRTDAAWNRPGACPACGFARELSRAWLHGRDNFTFTNLASGCYAVRLADEKGRTIGESQQVQLAAGAKSSIAFESLVTRSIEIEMIDVDGQSLSEEWNRRLTAKETATSEVVSYDDTERAFQCVFTDERGNVSHVTFQPPSPPGHHGLRPSAFGGRRLGTGIAHDPEANHGIDRTRKTGDVLRPNCDMPYFAPVRTECVIGELGIVTIGPLSSSSLKLRVSVPNASSEQLIPASRATTRVQVRLHAL